MRMTALLVASFAFAAQPPLPELRTEAAPGGSVFFVRNMATQPLTAFVIELVDYPGSSFALWKDEINGDPIAPGSERRIAVSAMMPGAVPEHMKLQAAVYADGASSGMAQKVADLIERRRAALEKTRDSIRRLESQHAPDAVIAALRTEERKLVASKPPLQP